MLPLQLNGSAFSKKAKALADAGLKRITVSLDSMDPDVFMKLNDVGFPSRKVLEGIKAAEEAGIPSIKINVVVKKSVNDDKLFRYR